MSRVERKKPSMIFKTSTSSAAVVSRLADDPEFAAESTKLSVLTRGLKDIDFEIEDLQIEIYRRQNPGAAIPSLDAALRAAEAAASASMKSRLGDVQALTSPSEVVLAGLALLRGEPMNLSSPQRALEEAHE